MPRNLANRRNPELQPLTEREHEILLAARAELSEGKVYSSWIAERVQILMLKDYLQSKGILVAKKVA